jgi:putative heme-binding domain-containing protein
MQRFILLFLAMMSGAGALAADSTKPTALPGAPAAAAPRAVEAPRPAASRKILELNDGDRVVFIGDTFIEREQLESYIETMLTLRFPDKKVIFRNIGWSADTPLGESRAGFDAPEKGFDRLKEHIAAVKPTVVFLSHGMSQSFNGPEGLPRFEADMRTLVKAIEEIAGAQTRIIFVGPIPHEKLPAPLPDPAPHNANLKLYNSALRKLAAERNAPFLDLFLGLTGPMASTTDPQVLTDDGIHLTPLGYWRAAWQMESQLALGGLVRVGLSTEGKIREGTTGFTVTNFQGGAEGFKFDAVATRHLLPPVPATNMQYLYRNAAARLGVTGLSDGDFALRINGFPVAVADSAGWTNAQFIFTGPMYDQAEEVRKVVQKKNELYFHRWRPANETYLFGFRKYEQGQNAKEIPMFDPLISKEEERIDELKKLRTFKFEVARATDDDRARAGKATKPVAKPSPLPQPLTPQATPTFDMGENLEVVLFAENPDLAKPIQMNFDTQGRLWVASSSVYPQIQPGQEANDKILVLEDTNGDGKADKTTVFADGLLIPTGVAPGDGGVYVANSTQLVFFKDTDGDGKADFKRIVLSSFGTEDTHHILHTLRWGFDGQLYMNQSIYIHSHIETPHGVVRLNSGGIWNFRPETMELGIHMKGLVNTWGHHFDKYGQSFATDGAGGEGINWVIPQAMYFTYAGARRILPSVSPGSYPKFCGLETIESAHFPEDWQGTMVTCDFRAHRVVRFGINDKDSAYITKELPDVMRTTNVTFRPIDVKLGPDGALYVADWSNPIIQHGEVDFRDPRRDHEHGRIWRVTYKGRPLVKAPKKDERPADWLEDLSSPNNFTRHRAQRLLSENRKSIAGDLTRWTAAQTTEQGQLEALWIHQTIDIANGALLEKVLNARDGRIRAAAVRVLSFWRDRLPNRDELLARAIADEHPRVRMEAMRALAKIPSAKSAELVLAATEKPLDKYLDYAAWLSINDLAEPWVNAVKAGEWKADGKEKQLAFALNALTPDLAAAALPSVLPPGDLPRDGSGPWIELIGKSGGAKQLTGLLEQTLNGTFDDNATARALAAMAEAARLRNARPEGDLNRIEKLLAASNEKTRVEAVRLAGGWKVGSLAPKLLEAARAKETPASVRQAAFQSLRDIGGGEALKGLAELAGAGSELPVRQQAVVTLAALDLKQAAPLAVETLSATTNENEALTLWRQLLSIKGAAPVFAQALPKAGLPHVTAKSGLRVAREGGRNEPNLVLALARNIENEEESKNLTPEELKGLIENISKNGDPARGEAIYRRVELGCVGCHAIGGVGGKVGPDMTSIGASAPIDYLVESLQFPNRKVKEGYHGTMIETKDDQEISGILVRETSDQLILRDASNKEVSIAKNNVAKRSATGSIMPAGLIDALSATEQADMYRFLSELGKPGKYDASKSDVARLYRVLAATIDLAQFGDDRVVARPLTDGAWGQSIALVDGSLPRAEMQRQVNRTGGRSVPNVYVAAQFTAPKDGPAAINIENAKPMAIFLDGKPVTSAALDVKAGLHTIILKLDAKDLPESLRLRSSEVSFSTQ